GQQQVGDGLDEEEDDDEHDRPGIGTQVRPEQRDQGSVPFPSAPLVASALLVKTAAAASSVRAFRSARRPVAKPAISSSVKCSSSFARRARRRASISPKILLPVAVG